MNIRFMNIAHEVTRGQYRLDGQNKKLCLFVIIDTSYSFEAENSDTFVASLLTVLYVKILLYKPKIMLLVFAQSVTE